MLFRRRVFADGVYTFFMRIVSMAMAAALGIFTARVLGPHGRGIYAMPMVSAGLVTAGFAGLTASVSYFMLRLQAGRGVLRPMFLAALAFLAVGAIATTIIAYGARAPWAAVPAVLSLPGPIGVAIASGYATGTKRIRITTSLSIYTTGSLILFMIASFLVLGKAPMSAITAWVVSSDLVAAIAVAWVVMDSRRLPEGTADFRDFAWYSMRTGAVNLVSLLNYRADIYMIAVLTSPQLLGMYTIGVTASETLLAATQVAAVVTSPHVASMEEGAAAALTARMMRHNILIAGICSGALAIVAPYIIELLYGHAFTPVVPALRVLLIGVFALSLGSPLSNFFTLRMGKPEVAFALASFSAIICIALSWILIPHLGLVGAAIGSTAAYVTVQALAIGYFKIVSKIPITAMLIPRWSDIMTYVHLASSFTRRGTIDSAT